MDAESRFSKFGPIAQFDFPKFYDDNKVLEIVRRLYGPAFNNIDFVVLYSSKKNKVILIIVSTNNSQNYFNGRLDICKLSKQEFYHTIKHLILVLLILYLQGD